MSEPVRPKRLFVLGDARQVHVVRWVRYFRDNGYDVLTASLEPTTGVAGATARIHIPSGLPGLVRYPLAVPEVRRLIRRFRPHIVSAHFLPNYGTIAALSGFSPWVLSAWGSDIMLLPQKSAFHMWRTRFVIRRASAVTSDAEVMSRRIAELGAPPHTIATFPYGVDRSVFYPAREPRAPDRNERAAPAGDMRVLSNRKLESVYDIETVIDGFSRASETIPGATLTIAGAGERDAALRRRAAGVPCAPAIRFMGAVAHEEMPDLLREHDIYVSMARSDTTSVSLLEAMATGLFPVVSDLPANREWVEHERNGLLVRCGDAEGLAGALVAAGRDPALRAGAARRNGEIIAQRADWFDNMAIVAKLFDQIIAAAQLPS